MTDQLTLARLADLLRECAGVDEEVDLSGDISEVAFDDLGYDSLALLNTAGRIERELSIKLPDGALPEAKTPGQLLETVNALVNQGSRNGR
ncbi:acyl carrier protein [Amycolatopsis rubida]|uniref:Acyl carrier protein n=1 Tax=Amycolatopsis rubida TaxID=112413 RepID=A0ABX0C5K8_9PSEU|nr:MULTISPECIES: acyl carrier protein [Amycolatopsis]MYW97971.1 actinorhodin polyketide synthase [Amycolatopsis rubida]NEC62956.1 acyl carrier protein [Amycolatopsis rubida]OAP22624.1 Oxytetracycline polyketide synthase acyl carrier protein [Amycolatopsis sp. M39]